MATNFLITLNGKPETIMNKLTIADLLEIKNRDQSYIAVALNEEIISKTRYAEIFLKEGDRLEILHPVGGG